MSSLISLVFTIFFFFLNDNFFSFIYFIYYIPTCTINLPVLYFIRTWFETRRIYNTALFNEPKYYRRKIILFISSRYIIFILSSGYAISVKARSRYKNVHLFKEVHFSTLWNNIVSIICVLIINFQWFNRNRFNTINVLWGSCLCCWFHRTLYVHVEWKVKPNI